MARFKRSSLHDSFLVVEGIRPCGFRGKKIKPISRTRGFTWEAFWSRDDGELVNRHHVWFPGVWGIFTRLLIHRADDWWYSFPLTVVVRDGDINATYELSFKPGAIRIEDPDSLVVY